VSPNVGSNAWVPILVFSSMGVPSRVSHHLVPSREFHLVGSYIFPSRVSPPGSRLQGVPYIVSPPVGSEPCVHSRMSQQVGSIHGIPFKGSLQSVPSSFPPWCHLQLICSRRSRQSFPSRRSHEGSSIRRSSPRFLLHGVPSQVSATRGSLHGITFMESHPWVTPGGLPDGV
jgi:hypothetical protein